MEWPPRGHPSFPCRSATLLSREIQNPLLRFDVLLLRGGELAAHPRRAGFLWAPGHTAHWIVPLSNRRVATGVAVGFIVHTRAGQSRTLRATMRRAHSDSAAGRHRMGFAPSFRRRSFPRFEMVGSGPH